VAVKKLVKDFRWASLHVLNFGKYKGRTVEGVASEDAGLRYLQNLNNLEDTWDDERD